MKTFTLSLLALVSLLISGCSTIENRIEEKSAVFNSLPSETQEQIKQGIVNVGFSPDMVYMALGRPDTIREKTTAAGREIIWVYKAFYQQYEGTQFVGYQRSMYFDRSRNVWQSYLTPVHADIYRDKTEELARISFKDAKVTVIEQTKS